jgi:ATP-dependent helicase HrpA
MRDMKSAPANIPLIYPVELPITERREEIIEAIRTNQVLVITGETGSGKSTQIPKMCLEAGQGAGRLIGCTQPRRIAAITLAQRVAEEMGPSGERLVGYKIRFQDRTARSTRIKFMTDGILLAEAQRDRQFRAYDTIIVDEAHERTLNIDLLIGLLQRILPTRHDLKIIVTSATIDPERFSRAFGGAPIIEVSGRTYPVEVWYRPLEVSEDKEGEIGHVDQAVEAIGELRARWGLEDRGDILVFMPTESDIRETAQRLEERKFHHTLVLPLFGRMAASDQQRVFQLTAEDRIIVATNVAETSITIPRIRYVIDTGLARISQYNARSRTQGLPIAPISRASADQRKGRCGRVEAGICIRLYSREEYEGRPLFTPPEILRSNLAEVILRMLYLKLGSIQDFPFIDAPSPAAIKDGFAVLKELGAVDDHRHLTHRGRIMARLPLDPRLGRMLLQARDEGGLKELKVLVAALSIQDPRERPLELEAQADTAHAAFRDRRSDFLSLLNIWNAVWGESAEKRSQGQLRRYCKNHFLSYRRLREWKDIHDEITDILEELGGFRPTEEPPGYDAIHRAVLSGYLSHVCMRKEKNQYLCSKGRQAMLFPGSGLFNRGGGWVVAAELVQTNRLYARTAADIEASWAEELGRHLCRYSYSDPHWEKDRGQVAAYERVTLYGLPVVERRKVNYGRIKPDEARAIFIRSALVLGELSRRYPFMEHNRELIRRIEDLENKARRRDLLVDQDTLFQFYDRRLPAISDVRSLERFVRHEGGDQALRMSEEDLLQTAPDFDVLNRYPDSMPCGDLRLPLQYAFKPGEDQDGVTVKVSVHALHNLSPEPFDWGVPGGLEERILALLKGLPKGLRKHFVPAGEMARIVAGKLNFGKGELLTELSRVLEEITGIRVPVDQWDVQSLPEHMRMRYSVVDTEGTVLAEGRDLNELRDTAPGKHEDELWVNARKRWEKDGLPLWDFGDIPSSIELGEDALGLMRYAYPTLIVDGKNLSLRLSQDPVSAGEKTREALMALYELAFETELKQLRRDWAFGGELASQVFFMGPILEANAQLLEYVLRELFQLHGPQDPDRQRFQETVRRLKGCFAAEGKELVSEAYEVVRQREGTRKELERFRRLAGGNGKVVEGMRLLERELVELVPPAFLIVYPRSVIQTLPHYLKALRIRGSRSYASPEKDQQKREQIKVYQARLKELEAVARATGCGADMQYLEDCRWMLEELKVAVFAPEMKTRFRISGKRLDEKWESWLEHCREHHNR